MRTMSDAGSYTSNGSGLGLGADIRLPTGTSGGTFLATGQGYGAWMSPSGSDAGSDLLYGPGSPVNIAPLQAYSTSITTVSAHALVANGIPSSYADSGGGAADGTAGLTSYCHARIFAHSMHLNPVLSCGTPLPPKLSRPQTWPLRCVDDTQSQQGHRRSGDTSCFQEKFE